MAIANEHELHHRRASRNIGVGFTLLAFVAVIFGLTIVKMNTGDSMQGADHTIRHELAPQEASP